MWRGCYPARLSPTRSHLTVGRRASLMSSALRSFDVISATMASYLRGHGRVMSDHVSQHVRVGSHLWLSRRSWSFAFRASSSGHRFLSAGLGSTRSLPRQMACRSRPSLPCRLQQCIASSDVSLCAHVWAMRNGLEGRVAGSTFPHTIPVFQQIE